MANVRLIIGKFAEARQDAEEGLKLHPSDERLRGVLIAVAAAQGDMQHAVALADEWIRLNPESGEGQFRRAMLHFNAWVRTNDKALLEEAVKDYATSVRLFPQPLTFVYLTDAYFRMGDYESAERTIEDGLHHSW